MMVTFVSQCEKKALLKTRRVLDAFANRIGDNTWQTVITDDGLKTVKKMLRKTASKNTAVSCHWIRLRSRSQFLWVVGNKNKFNFEGVVPVNSTEKDLLNSEIESDWKYLPLIKSLTALSALLHDWGKASKLFQEKLQPDSKNKFKGDPIRHEWISTLLLNALVNKASNDDCWLTQLIESGIDENALIKSVIQQNPKPLSKLPDAAKLIAWLIISHHRLPLEYNKNADWRGESAPDMESVLRKISKAWGYENKYDEADYQHRVIQCFEFTNGLLSQSKQWLERIKLQAKHLQKQLALIEQAMSDGSYRLILHHARLCLMLGDHNYSSQDAAQDWKDTTGLFANTDRETGELKQKLDEHLMGVCEQALDTAHLLPAFENEPPVAENVKALKNRSHKNFKWQDKAVDGIKQWRQTEEQDNGKIKQGFFAVNMAGTGCGKTFANAKIMCALSDDVHSLRYILALGLRTLTLQTGDEYRQRIFEQKKQRGQQDQDNLAVLIGSNSVTELHYERCMGLNESTYESWGSESSEDLLNEDIEYDCDIPEGGLTTILTKEKDRKFLYAPILVCTIDHIMAATETKRGGRFILPGLRLMSSDLVIDEIDDFTGSDLIAIGRLIHLAGMLGRKVMISSATIPPDLAEGYFNAYKKGWQIFRKSRDQSINKIGCAWIDEKSTMVESINIEDSEQAITCYQSLHNQFIDKRIAHLKKQPAKRKVNIINCHSSMIETNEEQTKQQHYFQHIEQAIIEQHFTHSTIDKKTGIAVSFGVVRVANISPCVTLTRHLLQADFPDDIEVKTMAYHSRQVMLLRHKQEEHLDLVLKRKEEPTEQPDAFSNSIIRQHLDRSSTKHIVFVLVATPVEEVGRDHDFDWAIIEPSSYRSIIQLAGRVRRHRAGKVEQPNVSLMQYNWRAYKENDQQGKKYFNRPGYEDSKTFPAHNISELLDTQKIRQCLDAVPRIQIPDNPKEQMFAAMEHVVIQEQLTAYKVPGGKIKGADCLQGYLNEAWYLTALPQLFHAFRNSQKTTNLFLSYDEYQDGCYFVEKDAQGKPTTNREKILGITQVSLTNAEECNLWLSRDYQELLDIYSDKKKFTKRNISFRYGELNFPINDNAEYEYNDQFGLVKI